VSSRKHHSAPKPPRFLLRVFKWFCHPDLHTYVEGDLLEIYLERVAEKGKVKANLRFALDVLLLFRPNIIRPLEGHNQLNRYGIFKNYLKIGFRSLTKNYVFSSINLFGLSLALASFLTIGLYIFSELSYDEFHEHKDNLYRVSLHMQQEDENYQSAQNFGGLGPLLTETFSEVKQYTRVYPHGRQQFSCAMVYEDGTNKPISFNEPSIVYADASFFNLFTFKLLKGNTDLVLKEPFTAVITRETALKYFGEEEPIGKSLQLLSSSENRTYTVTGVMEIPENTHISTEVLLSMSSLNFNVYTKDFEQELKENDDFYTYVLLDEATSLSSFKEKLTAISQQLSAINEQEVHLELQLVKDIYLYSDLKWEFKNNGNITHIYFLGTVAFLIILIAWVNYLNLTASQYIQRVKEFSLRKVVGARGFEIQQQIFIETLLFISFSIVIGLGFIGILSSISGFESYLQKIQFNLKPILTILGIFILGGLFFGIYPARFLIAIKGTYVLSGKFKHASSGIILRKSLIIFQFAIAFSLIAGLTVFNAQFSFLQNQDLGLDSHGKLIVKAPAAMDSTYSFRQENFKSELLQNPKIRQVSLSAMVPGKDVDWYGEVRNRQKVDGKQLVFYVIGPDFFQNYGIQLLAGRQFTYQDNPAKRFGEKVEKVILNKKGCELLGYTSFDQAIGQTVYWEDTKCEIVGVVADYHQQSFLHPLEPIFFVANSRDIIYYTISFSSEDDGNFSQNQSLSSIQSVWEKYFPLSPFEYYYLEDSYAQQYASSLQMGSILGFASFLAIIIACLGLLALSFYASTQRIKEIGIRKILGGSVSHIFMLLSRDFVFLILIACLIALPIIYTGINYWLATFPFRITITGWYFILPALLTLGIGLLTIGCQTLKAALSNPIDSLRSE